MSKQTNFNDKNNNNENRCTPLFFLLNILNLINTKKKQIFDK